MTVVSLPLNSITRNKLKSLYKLDNYHGVLQVIEDYICIILATVLSETCFFSIVNLNVIYKLVMYVIALVVIGSRMRALAELLHQSTHQTLAKSKWLNFLLGSVFSGYLVFQSWTGYRYSHCKKHHGHFGDANNDPDYVELQNAGLYSTSDNEKLD
ncbi:hypothetical protein ABK040_016212 [Willaertia magna]